MGAMAQICLSLPLSLLEQVDAVAKSKCVPRVSLVRTALRYYLAAFERARLAGKVLCLSGHQHDNQQEATVCNAG